MLYILGRLSLLLAMVHHKRAIRLLADQLGFSIVHCALLTASDMAEWQIDRRAAARAACQAARGQG